MLIDESPVALPKAIKNPTEIRGMKNANVGTFLIAKSSNVF